MERVEKAIAGLGLCLILCTWSAHSAFAQEGPPPGESAPGGPGGPGGPPPGEGGPGGPGGPPPGKEEPVTVPPADFNATKMLAEAQRAYAQGRYAEVVEKYANPIINYYAYRYGTRGRRMFVAHDATETAIYVATGARALDLSINDGVLNGAALPPEAVKGSRNIVVPEGTLSDTFAIKAKALAKLGSIDEALQMLGRSTVLSPNYPTYWNDLAEVYRQAGRCEDAAKAYAQAEETVKQMSDEALKQAQSSRTRKGKAKLAQCR